MRRKKLWLAAVICAAAIGCVCILTLGGKKPFKDLRLEDIVSAAVRLTPPEATIEISDTTELVGYLNEVVIYREDNSYSEYCGQGVIFTITKTDGSQTKIMAYNPFIIIDGVGYRCKYEPCEKLNNYANRMLREGK